MKVGILENAHLQFEKKVFQSENPGIVRLDYISEMIKYQQAHKLDAHVLIGGQNGTGKSMLLLALMKKIDENSLKNNQILYAFDKHLDFIEKLKILKNTVLGVDEINVFLNYKQSMTSEQIALFNFIEIAREHRVAIISCCRDGRRVNNNYRDGKASIYIFVVDRYERGDVKTYALVFLGNPVLEENDKFMINSFQNILSFEELRLAAEALPTFYGYLFMEDIKDYVSEKELKEYENKKEEGIQAVYDKWVDKLEQKDNKVQNKYNKQNAPYEIPEPSVPNFIKQWK